MSSPPARSLICTRRREEPDDRPDHLPGRCVFLTGLGVFTLASLACGLAQSQEALVVARIVQGIGGAMTSAVILGMIVTMFPSPASR